MRLGRCQNKYPARPTGGCRLLDEGRLTDAYGRTTNFRSAVIIMTSNLGGESSRPPGFDPSAEPNYEGAVTSFFRPEFYNRIDAVVRFGPLTREQVLAITRKELNEIARREGLAKAAIELVPSERLIEHLAALGYDPRYGARPLQRVPERQVVTPLARWVIEHPGLSHCRLGLDADVTGDLRVIAVADYCRSRSPCPATLLWRFAQLP